MHDSDPTTRLTVTAPDGAVHDLATAEAQDAIDAYVAAELADDRGAPEPEWADDGHRVRVALALGAFEFTVLCPYDPQSLAGTPWAELPLCRRACDIDGNPAPHKSPTADCGLRVFGEEWAAEEFFDGGAPAFEVGVFPVAYRFEGYDGAVYVRPKTGPQSAASLELEAVTAFADAYDATYDTKEPVIARVWTGGVAAGPAELRLPDLRAVIADAEDARDVDRLRRSHDAIWAVVADLRAAAVAEGRDPYADPVAQRLSAALVGARWSPTQCAEASR